MTEMNSDGIELRNWLVANLCARLGCGADEIDLDAEFVCRLGKYQAREIIGLWILLPVNIMIFGRNL